LLSDRELTKYELQIIKEIVLKALVLMATATGQANKEEQAKPKFLLLKSRKHSQDNKK
jgi:hypothetical protein